MVFVATDSLGEGSAELGVRLMSAFFHTLKEVPPLPTTIVLMNSGVKLAVPPKPLPGRPEGTRGKRSGTAGVRHLSGVLRVDGPVDGGNHLEHVRHPTGVVWGRTRPSRVGAAEMEEPPYDVVHSVQGALAAGSPGNREAVTAEPCLPVIPPGYTLSPTGQPIDIQDILWTSGTSLGLYQIFQAQYSNRNTGIAGNRGS